VGHANFFQEGFVVKHLATMALVTLLAAGAAAQARDTARPRGAHANRATQPHTRTTERQRTESGRTRSDTVTRGDGSTASRRAEVVNDADTGTRTRNVDYTGFDGKARSVDRVSTKTDDGYTRETTATGANGQTATRNLDVSRNPETGTIHREANYSTSSGRTGSTSDVIQRTEDGYSRDTTHTTPDGRSHTRSVDVSCDKDANKCVKQVDVGQQP
jgi:hypothetical protein